MKTTKSAVVLSHLKAANTLLMTGIFGAFWFAKYLHMIHIPYYFWGNICMMGIYLMIYSEFVRVYDALQISQLRISESVYSQLLALLLSDAVLYGICCLLAYGVFNPIPVLHMFACQCVAASGWSYFGKQIYCSVCPPRKTVLVYGGTRRLEPLFEKYSMQKCFSVEASVSLAQCLNDFSLLDGAETVFLSETTGDERSAILKHCMERGMTVYLLTDFADAMLHGAQPLHLFHRTLLCVKPYHPSAAYRICKRCLDIILSGAALLLLLPVAVAVAAAVKLEDGGPVFYVQERLTKNGKVFRMHKFRSMHMDAEKDAIPRLSAGSLDPRVTRTGRFLRRYRLDELPQLADILVGNLSLVGPRPERPEIAAQYEEKMPEFRLRLQGKAGLTGYAQVYGKYNSTPEDKLQMDLLYMSHPSLLSDLRILLATIKILFMPESTEGVDAEQCTAMK